MEISYNWIINPLECYPTSSQGPDYVFTAHWQIYATKVAEGTTYTATNRGSQLISGSQSKTFIPFEELTLPVVQEWVEASMGIKQVEAIKASLSQSIADQINPPIITLQSPWLTTI